MRTSSSYSSSAWPLSNEECRVRHLMPISLALNAKGYAAALRRRVHVAAKSTIPIPQAPQQIQIPGLLGPNIPMPKQEINDHQVTVILEKIGRPHNIRHTLNLNHPKALHLPILIHRHKTFRNLQIVTKQNIPLQSVPVDVHIRYSPHRFCPARNGSWNSGFLFTFFDDILIARQPVRQASGHQMVEPSWVSRFRSASLSNPQMLLHVLVYSLDIAVHVHTVSLYPKIRSSCPLQQEKGLRRPEGGFYRVHLVPYSGNEVFFLLAQAIYDVADGFCPAALLLRESEHVFVRPEVLPGEFTVDVADDVAVDGERDEFGFQLAVVAVAYGHFLEEAAEVGRSWG
ncbi:induction: the S. cerevisiae ATR1 transcriptionis induced by aminotriazole [Striga asiatica]|uniref:Induction: the S. cerevisiae ATR1 transcriptionis induced by aminotriazole n=1 Tax=Striga asiatica TaxID=4170 RepID=A0A5A7PYH9_STRAF|nr:induction: the S. cerevisiae ATR1 transcriptionis induced by aminotriazole [Striga asiatica]